jgi:hypothetical protein
VNGGGGCMYIADVLHHVADDPVCLSWARVIIGISISEDLQSTAQRTLITKGGNMIL